MRRMVGGTSMMQQPAATMTADLLIPFCEASSLNVRDVSRTVRKRIVVSLSFTDHRELHERLFKDHHIDWAGVNDYLQVGIIPLRSEGGSPITAGHFLHASGLDVHHGPAGLCAGSPFCLVFHSVGGVMFGVQEAQPSAELGELLQSAFAGLRVSGTQTKDLSPLESLRLCFARSIHVVAFLGRRLNGE